MLYVQEVCMCVCVCVAAESWQGEGPLKDALCLFACCQRVCHKRRWRVPTGQTMPISSGLWVMCGHRLLEEWAKKQGGLRHGLMSLDSDVDTQVWEGGMHAEASMKGMPASTCRWQHYTQSAPCRTLLTTTAAQQRHCLWHRWSPKGNSLFTT